MIELVQHPELYVGIYRGANRVERAVLRVSWEGHGCGEEHYMCSPADLFVIATVFGCGIILLHPVLAACVVVLPLRRLGAADRPAREIFICHLNRYKHYIRVDCVTDCPIPPVHTDWHDCHDETVAGWDRYYESKIRLWNSLRPPPTLEVCNDLDP